MHALRPYQREAVDAVYRHLRERDDNPCVVLPTASGKTHVLATICKDAVGLWGGRVLVLAHVKELLQQAVDKLDRIAPELAPQVGVYSAGLKSREARRPIVVAGIQSVYRRANEIGHTDLAIVDECFVAGTMIATPRGEVPIETLRTCQAVMTAMGVGVIEAISIRQANTLVEVETEDGTILVCTPNHPFFTERGWIQAGSLEVGSRLFRQEDLRLLRSGVPSLDLLPGRREGPQLSAGEYLEQAAVLLDILRQEDRQPDDVLDQSGEGSSNSLEASASADPEGREREALAAPAACAVACAGTRLGGRVRPTDPGAAGERDPEALQDRYREPDGADRAGAGRSLPQRPADRRCRSPEGDAPRGTRVARVTPLKPGGDAVVFNLHVRGHPSYYAGGVLVHNCHLIPEDGEGMYRTLLADLRAINPAIRIIGLTATPFRMTSGPICTPSNILNHVAFEVGVRELIAQGYLSPLRAKAGREKTDTSGLHVRGGEYVASEVEEMMDQERLVEAACREILEETRDRKSVLVFASGVRHGGHVAETLKRLGVEVATVFGDTLDFERDRVLQDFKAGRLKYLVNVQVLTTGFDAPNVDCVALLRPTMSPGLYAQMLGRAFRLHPGKADAIVLDFGGNVLRHGPVDAIRVPDPKGESTPEGPPAKECPECRALVAPGYAVCPQCGYEFERKEREAKHEASAATAGILTGQVTTERHPVLEVAYHVHQKRGAPEGAPRSMRVEYRIGFNRYQSEWVCFEHEGFARHKAVAWWKRRSSAPVPKTAEDAVALAEAGALAETKAITVRSVAGEDFSRIQEHELGDKPFYREPGWDEEEETAAAGQAACSAAADGEVPF